jgi:hypothetical protein
LIEFTPHTTPTAINFYTGPQAGDWQNQMLVTLFVRYLGQGGELKRFRLTGDAMTGFEVAESSQLVDFGLREEDDGPVDIAIDPISGDILVARVDLTPNQTPSNRRNLIYRIHRQGSDLLPLIGPVSPSSIEAGSGMRTITLRGRHLKPGATVYADGLALTTRQGASPFDLEADLTVAAETTAAQARIIRSIQIEVRNPDGLRSNAQTITVTAQEPDDSPRLASLSATKKNGSPVDNLKAGSKAKKFRLVVVGENFDAGAILTASGSEMQITDRSATRLEGRFTNSMIASPGELVIQVRNSTGKLSNTLRLTVAPAQ